jgi:hypothetical protein
VEFFAEINNIKISTSRLKNQLTIGQLPALCHSIDTVILDNKINGIIYCVWGEFKVHREELDYGIRFTLPHCPNSLAWTITRNEASNIITIHCTINTKTHDAAFIESIEQFVADWEIK